MITEDIINKRFIDTIVRRDIGEIYDTQNEVVNTYLRKRTGALSNLIQTAPFSSEGTTARPVFYMRLLPYLRFLDIQYRTGSDRISQHIRRNLALYNRVVWGVLYRETFPAIRYGLTEDVRREIIEELKATYPKTQI